MKVKHSDKPGRIPRAVIHHLPWAGYLVMLSLGSKSTADMISSEGVQPWELCALCHGLNGASAVDRFPHLAGQRPGYIVKQFNDFASRRRNNDGGQMQAMGEQLAVSHTDIERIADYFSTQIPPTVAPAANEALFIRGRAIYQQARTEGACIQCHDSTAANATTPLLKGQHAGYLQKQLDDFKSERRSNDDGVMKTIATTLSSEEITAVSYFLQHAGATASSTSNHHSSTPPWTHR